MEDILAIILIFGGGTLVTMSFSPIGKAFAARIRGDAAAPPEPDPAVLAELDDLRLQVNELHERLDFAERLLSKPAEAQGVPRAGGGA